MGLAMQLAGGFHDNQRHIVRGQPAHEILDAFAGVLKTLKPRGAVARRYSGHKGGWRYQATFYKHRFRRKLQSRRCVFR